MKYILFFVKCHWIEKAARYGRVYIRTMWGLFKFSNWKLQPRFSHWNFQFFFQSNLSIHTGIFWHVIVSLWIILYQYQTVRVRDCRTHTKCWNDGIYPGYSRIVFILLTICKRFYVTLLLHKKWHLMDRRAQSSDEEVRNFYS